MLLTNDHICRKIKRIVFEAVRKFNGYEEIVLSTSQTKQIAGRAGRYGLHSEAGGFTTTLYPNDLPILRKALDTPTPPISTAYQYHTAELCQTISQALPIDSSMMTLREVLTHVAKMRWPYHMQSLGRAEVVCDFIDNKLPSLPLAEKVQVMASPISWREEATLKIVAEFLQQYCDDYQVNLVQTLALGPLRHLEAVEANMMTDSAHGSQEALNILEGMHKLIVFYMWMNMRNPVAWHHRAEAEDLKERTEKALDWLLQRLSHDKRPELQLLQTAEQHRDRIAFRRRGDARAQREAGDVMNSYRAAGMRQGR